MFTGIITDVGTINRTKSTNEGLQVTFTRPKTWSTLQLGESIATNGVCLTVESMSDTVYSCVLVPETLRKSSFGNTMPAKVNLERAMTIADRFGGHFVQGHVDGVGHITRIDKDKDWRLYISFDLADEAYIIPKGSISLNGVSLTVANISNHVFEVALIPHTLKHTALATLHVGDEVNIEFDMIGKYVAKIMEKR